MKRTIKRLISICLAVLMMGILFACDGTVDLTDNLDEYKAKAKEELENYAINKGEENYFEDNWIKILEYIDEGISAIDEATSKSEIDDALTNAKIEIDRIPADKLINLDEWKEKAKAELENYATDKGRESYFEGNWIKILECVDKGKAAIDDAASKSAIDNALTNAKKEIDKISAENMADLYEYKENAKAELEKYAVDKGEKNYIVDYWIKVLECVDEGKEAIDDAASKSEIDDALTNAKIEIDKIPYDILEVDIADMIELHTWFLASGLQRNAINVKSDIANATFDCIVYDGHLIDMTLDNLYGTVLDDIIRQDPKFKRRTLNNNETIYWWADIFDKDAQTVGFLEHDFVDIIVHDGDYIIGYAVIEIFLEKGLDYDAVVLKSAIFPKVKGSYQKITEDMLKIKLDEIKKG